MAAGGVKSTGGLTSSGGLGLVDLGESAGFCSIWSVCFGLLLTMIGRLVADGVTCPGGVISKNFFGADGGLAESSMI